MLKSNFKVQITDASFNSEKIKQSKFKTNLKVKVKSFLRNTPKMLDYQIILVDGEHKKDFNDIMDESNLARARRGKSTLRVASRSGREQRSIHQPQRRGKSPTSAMHSRDTFITT